MSLSVRADRRGVWKVVQIFM